jgi:hypothetical protein
LGTIPCSRDSWLLSSWFPRRGPVRFWLGNKVNMGGIRWGSEVMRRFLIYSFLLLPLIGIGLGYSYAYVYYHGILESWHLIGNPGERIAQILGTRGETGGRKLLVETATGQIYSFVFFELRLPGSYEETFRPDRYGIVLLPAHISWEIEENGEVERVQPLIYIGPDFISRRPPSQIEQLHVYDYIYHVEGKGQVKFAMDPEGNLWVWEHKIAGLTGLVFYFYPATGFLIGLAAVVLIFGDRVVLKKRRISNEV